MSDTGEPCEVTELSGGDYHVLWYAEQCLLLLQNHLAAAGREHQRPVA